MMNTISLSFKMQKGSLQLESSTVNAALDETTSKVAGRNLKFIIDKLNNPMPNEGESILAKAIEQKESFEVTLFLPNHTSPSVQLNPKFMQALSGSKQPLRVEKKIDDDFVMIPENPRENSTHIMGLHNTSGTDCFMNAMIQVIVHDDLIKAAILKSHKSNTNQALMTHYVLENYPTATLPLRNFMPKGQQTGQQDTTEFLDSLMQPYNHEDSPDLFPVLVTTYHWEKRSWGGWGSVTDTKTTSDREPLIYIPLEITKGSGQELINQHFALKKHEGEKYKDHATGIEFSPGQVQLQIEGAPKRIIFMLKRFTSSSKINTTVDMPESIVINNHFYALRKIVQHHGKSRLGGHYTALIKKGEHWIRADDSRISVEKDPTSARQNGYIYFYELLD